MFYSARAWATLMFVRVLGSVLLPPSNLGCATPKLPLSRSSIACPHGSENVFILADAARHPSKFANRHLQNRVIQKGDQIALLVEERTGGMYTELGRSCVVGAKVPQA